VISRDYGGEDDDDDEDEDEDDDDEDDDALSNIRCFLTAMEQSTSRTADRRPDHVISKL